MEARWLLSFISKIDYESMIMNCNQLIAEPISKKYTNIINDRALNKKPIQLIMGSATFYNREFNITNDVFIPRQDSEVIIDVLKKKSFKSLIDICTGSGCLALSAYLEIANITVDAIDNSLEAIQVFKNNQKFFNCEKDKNINVSYMDILKDKPNKIYDMVLCNPPYISYKDYLNLPDDVLNYEPQNALTDQKDGLSFYIRLAEIGREIKTKNGSIIIEFGADNQINKIKKIFHNYTLIEIKNDLNNIPRIMEFV